MAKEYITEKIWYDLEVKSYVMLDVTEEIGEQKPLKVNGIELLPKEEYHVTLVAAGKIADGDEKLTRNLISDISKYLLSNPESVSFGGLGDERFTCHKDGETTLIAPAVIIGIEGLRKVVTSRIVNYKPAFPHVTLLKSENSLYGIGVNSQDDLEQYCRRL